MAAPMAASSNSAILVCSAISTFSRSWDSLTVSNSDLIRGPRRGRFTLRFQRDFVSEVKKNYSALKLSKGTKWEVGAQRATVWDEGPITYDRLMPCPKYSSPSRVEHLLIEKNGNVVDVVCEELSLPPLYVADLIRFRAVFYALERPTPPPSASPEQFDAYHRVLKLRASRKEEQLSLKGKKTLQEAQKTYRIGSSSEYIEAGTYVRVHVHPRRCPRVYKIDWLSRIVAETDSFVVVDKPAGVSVGGTVDNLEEKCATFVSRALKLKEPPILLTKLTHVLKEALFLRRQQFSSHFHMLLGNRKVKKEYTVLAAAPVAPGHHVHYMGSDSYAPRMISNHDLTNWSNCELEVLGFKQVKWPSAAVGTQYLVAHCGWESREHAYECSVRLLIGRTHQTVQGSL